MCIADDGISEGFERKIVLTNELLTNNTDSIHFIAVLPISSHLNYSCSIHL